VGTRTRRRLALPLVTAVLLVVGCTSSPEPAPPPSPEPDEAAEPTPSGIRVAVVLPPAGDPMAAAFLDVPGELATMSEGRVGDVAAVRSVQPDGAGFVQDVAALLADQGEDLVCVLGDDGVRTVLTLADRFPATRFCAIAPPRDGQPDNVELFDVAHEEVGHVLGAALAATVGTGEAGIVLGDDGGNVARRRAGARAALAGTDVLVDTVVTDASEVTALVGVLEDAELDAVLVDLADPVLATAVAGAAPGWIGPRGVPIDASAGAAVVRWSLRADVIVGEAVDRLIGNADDDQATTLGVGDDVLTLTFADDVAEAVRTAAEVAIAELAAGVRDPVGPSAPDAS
jgi:hypothetical protein